MTEPMRDPLSPARQSAGHGQPSGGWMTAQEERMIGRLTRAVGWGALGLVVAGTVAAVRLNDATTDARDRVGRLEPRVERLERRTDSLLIELRHLPDAVADTLAARERRSR